MSGWLFFSTKAPLCQWPVLETPAAPLSWCSWPLLPSPCAGCQATCWSCVCTWGCIAMDRPGRCSTLFVLWCSTCIPASTLCCMCCCPNVTATGGQPGSSAVTGTGCTRRSSASPQTLRKPAAKRHSDISQWRGTIPGHILFLMFIDNQLVLWSKIPY